MNEFDDINVMMDNTLTEFEERIKQLKEDLAINSETGQRNITNPEVIGFAVSLYFQIKKDYLDIIHQNMKNYHMIVTLQKHHNEYMEVLSGKNEPSQNVDEFFG